MSTHRERGPRTLALPPWVTHHAAEFGPAGERGAYRYVLTRSWESGAGTVNVIMLNPSTATHLEDDPTIRRCEDFARRWGYRRVTITNLFAFRATEPAGLRRTADPIGPENDWYVRSCAQEADRVLVAWGTHGSYRGRDRAVLALLEARWRGGDLLCLGVTRDGHPRHPLYLRMETVPQRYRVLSVPLDRLAQGVTRGGCVPFKPGEGGE